LYVIIDYIALYTDLSLWKPVKTEPKYIKILKQWHRIGKNDHRIYYCIFFKFWNWTWIPSSGTWTSNLK